MFEVHVTVVLIASDGIIGLARRLSLPFVPSPGLELLNITARPDIPDTIAEVAWDEEQACFEVELEDEYRPDATLAELGDEYGPEWEQEEPKPRVLRIV